MATIPTYTGPQVKEQALEGGFQRPAPSAAAFGAAQGVALEQAGNALAKWQSKMQEQEDADVVFRTETALKTEYLDFQDKLRQSRQGATAKGVTVDAEKWWADAEQRFSAGLNDRQKNLVGQTGSRLRLQSIDSFRDYEMQERNRSEKESWNASKASEARIAIANPKAEVVSASIDSIRKKNAYMAQKEGWGAETLTAKNLEDTNIIHKEILNGLLKTADPVATRMYFDANRKEIDPAFYDTIESAIKGKEIEVTAVRTADSMMGKSYEEGIAEISKIGDVKLREATRQRFKENVQDSQILERERELKKVKEQTRAKEAVWGAVANGKKPAKADLDAMNQEERVREVNAYFAAKAKASVDKTSGKLHAKEDNYEALDLAENLIQIGDVKDVKELERFAPFLRAETYRGLRKSLEKREEVSQTEVEKAFMDSIGKPRARWEASDYKEWVAFQNYINTNVKETKRPEDLSSWSERWFRSGYRKSEKDDFFSSSMTFGQAKTKGVSDFLFKTPKEVEPFINDMAASMRSIKKANPSINVTVPGGSTAGDELYTNYYKDATVWFSARKEQISGPRAAAYAILRQNNKPVTTSNINAVISEMKGK